MKRPALIVFLTLFSTLAVSAELQEKSAAFLKELGIDPTSREVRLIINDQVGKYNLDALAARNSELDVKRFIATRNYIRKFKQNPKTPQPYDYEVRFVKPDEVEAIKKEIIKEMLNRK